MQFSLKHVMQWFDTALDFVVEQWRIVAVVAVAGVFAGMGWWVYTWHCHEREVKAHTDFVHALKFLRAKVSPSKKSNNSDIVPIFGSDEEKWTKVSDVFAKTYQDNKSSGLAGIFLGFQADAAARLGKYEDAIALLSRALPSIASKPVREFYDVKLALFKIDSAQEATRARGVAHLETIIRTPHHYGHELALYHLGMFHWISRDYQKAKDVWQQLVVQYSSGKNGVGSGLVDMVKSKLKLISADF